MTYEERARVFEVLRELARTTKVPVILPLQPRPEYRHPERRRWPDFIFIDHLGELSEDKKGAT